MNIFTPDFSTWYEGHVRFDATNKAPYQELYTSYIDWSNKQNICPQTTSSFSKQLRGKLNDDLLSKKVRRINNNRVIYVGIRLEPFTL